MADVNIYEGVAKGGGKVVSTVSTNVSSPQTPIDVSLLAKLLDNNTFEGNNLFEGLLTATGLTTLNYGLIAGFAGSEKFRTILTGAETKGVHNVTEDIQLNGTSINDAGTLSNVQYYRGVATGSLDNITDVGNYRIGSPTTGGTPVPVNNGHALEVYRGFDDNARHQVFYTTASQGDGIWKRYSGDNGANWSDWKEFYHSGNSNKLDVDWSAKNVITNGFVGSNAYSNPSFTGEGWRVGNSGDAVFDNLTVRKAMNVYELNIDKIRSGNGSYWFSDGAKIIDVIDEPNEYITFYFDEDTGNPFRENDIIRCQVWTGLGIKYYEYRASAASENHTNTYSKFLENTKVGSGIPAAGDEIVRIDNTVNSDRQGAIYITSNDDNSPYMDVIHHGSTKVRVGLLDGITDPNFSGISGFGLYAQNAFLTGGINASYGNIGGLEIEGNKLVSENEKLTIDAENNVISIYRESNTGFVSAFNLGIIEGASKIFKAGIALVEQTVSSGIRQVFHVYGKDALRLKSDNKVSVNIAGREVVEVEEGQGEDLMTVNGGMYVKNDIVCGGLINDLKWVRGTFYSNTDSNQTITVTGLTTTLGIMVKGEGTERNVNAWAVGGNQCVIDRDNNISDRFMEYVAFGY